MKAVDVASVWLKKIEVIKIGIRWIFYALMALFALNALGLFQTLLGLGSSGITFTFELSLALVFGLFLYLSFESNKHAARLEGRVTVVTVGLEANIQSLKKIEEKSSEIGGRIDGMEGLVTKIGGGVANVEGTLSKIEQEMSEIGGRVDGLDAKASTIQEGAANLDQTLSKIGEGESAIGGRVGGLEEMVTNIEGGVSNIEGKLSKIDEKADVTILDVREPFEYEICRLDGSKLIPLGELPERVNELSTADQIVVHCHSGARSAQAVKFLNSLGFKKAKNLKGGIAAWAKEIDRSMPTY